MTKARLEAFSDGVIAIIITIMVLELQMPHGAALADLRPLIPVLISYMMSFVYIGIYWANHHHLLQAVQRVDGRALWANLHLLFWLSLVPATTAWMGETHFAEWPVALYGLVLLSAGVAYFILSRSLIALHGQESVLATAVGADRKGRLSVALYALAVPVAFANRWIACAVYVAVAAIWLVPDRRIEDRLRRDA
ncbi:MAG TPA: TMEM175 family protein [Gemmatimonadales bacterium]